VFSKIVYPLAFLVCCTGLGTSVFYALRQPVQYISLKPRFDEDIRILDVHCTRSYYDVEVVKSEPAESIVKVTFLPEKKLPGERKAIVELRTSSERQPTYQFELTCEP